jgi:TonB dependent receptor-like, beta-barrel
VQYDRIGNSVLSGETGNLVRLYWNRTLGGQRGTYGYYRVRSNGVLPDQGFITQGDIHENNWGFFVQDSWTIGQRLTLNLGLRSEREKVPSYSWGVDVLAHPIDWGFGDKIAPRVGFAWDATGDGKTQVYGSWGIFYDIMSARVSYTWSRLSGNHSGLAQSDENGRTSPNVGRAFDYPLMAFDQSGKPVYGRLGTDRTHQLKAFGTYDFSFGTTATIAVVRGVRHPDDARGGLEPVERLPDPVPGSRERARVRLGALQPRRAGAARRQAEAALRLQPRYPQARDLVERLRRAG